MMTADVAQMKTSDIAQFSHNFSSSTAAQTVDNTKVPQIKMTQHDTQ